MRYLLVATLLTGFGVAIPFQDLLAGTRPMTVLEPWKRGVSVAVARGSSGGGGGGGRSSSGGSRGSSGGSGSAAWGKGAAGGSPGTGATSSKSAPGLAGALGGKAGIPGRYCPCTTGGALGYVKDRTGGPWWTNPLGQTIILSGILALLLQSNEDTIDIAGIAPTHKVPNITGQTVNKDAKMYYDSISKPRNCHQALVEFAQPFQCSANDTEVETSCLDAIGDFALTGDINGKFAETPEMINSTCGNCTDGKQYCVCDMKSWRYRDWEYYPTKLKDWEFVDWMGGGEKVHCQRDHKHHGPGGYTPP